MDRYGVYGGCFSQMICHPLICSHNNNSYAHCAHHITTGMNSLRLQNYLPICGSVVAVSNPAEIHAQCWPVPVPHQTWPVQS